MECKKCKSSWESQINATKSMTKCPFCGESLADDPVTDKEGTFDNSRDALIYIAKKHGADVLLGSTLKFLFCDYAPLVSKQVKNFVIAVFTNGAATALRDVKAADREIAFKKAVAKLTDAFFDEKAAIAIILEFTEALGWDITPPHTTIGTDDLNLTTTHTQQSPVTQAHSNLNPTSSEVKSRSTCKSSKTGRSVRCPCGSEHRYRLRSVAPLSNSVKLEYDNGDIYKGEIQNGKRQGKGIYTWKEGTTFEGDWVAGKYHGYGIMKYPNGKSKSGYYENGKFVCESFVAENELGSSLENLEKLIETLLSYKDFCEAENTIFIILEEFVENRQLVKDEALLTLYQCADRLYCSLDKYDEQTLKENNFSKEEVEEGWQKFSKEFTQFENITLVSKSAKVTENDLLP